MTYLPGEIWGRIWFYYLQPVIELEKQEDYVEENYEKIVLINEEIAKIKFAANNLDEEFEEYYEEFIEELNVELDECSASLQVYEIIFQNQCELLSIMRNSYLEKIIS